MRARKGERMVVWVAASDGSGLVKERTACARKPEAEQGASCEMDGRMRFECRENRFSRYTVYCVEAEVTYTQRAWSSVRSH